MSKIFVNRFPKFHLHRAIDPPFSLSCTLMSLNNKRYLVIRVRGCRSSGSCVFKRQCRSIFKKGKMDLVYGNFVRNICKKALGFLGVSLYQYDSFIIPDKNLVLITIYKLIIFLLKSS